LFHNLPYSSPIHIVRRKKYSTKTKFFSSVVEVLKSENMNVSADDGVIVALAAATVVVVVVVTEMQHAAMSAVVALLHVVAAQSAFALVLSYLPVVPQKSAGVVEHLSGTSSNLQHAAMSTVVALLHVVVAQFVLALVSS
jgi:hypothetical protein